MPIKDFTNRKAVQILATKSRRTDLSSIELCKVHYEIGKYLAYEILEEFELKIIEIQHVQGIRTGAEIDYMGNLIVMGLMRAGLYAAEGVRSVFEECEFIAFDEKIVHDNNFKNKTIIVVDAVINTGKTIEKVIELLKRNNAIKVIVAAIIVQKDALELAEKYPNVSFYAFRISENKYKGVGVSDTGNRLFNTKTNE